MCGPPYSDTVVLTDEAVHIRYALEEDVEPCEKLDGLITGGAKASDVKSAVGLAMIDARNQAVLLSANRLVYVDTEYTNFFGVNYVGIQSNMYKCSMLMDSAKGYVSTNANATAEIQAQKKAAQAAHMPAMQAAQQQAMQQAQQQIQQNQQSINSFKF